MKRRLPFLIVGLIGIWLWQGGLGLVPLEHTIVWKVPAPSATVRKVEAQLWDGDELLTKIELTTPTGALLDPEKKLTLAKGTYRSQLLVWRAEADRPEVTKTEVVIGSDTTVVIR